MGQTWFPAARPDGWVIAVTGLFLAALVWWTAPVMIALGAGQQPNTLDVGLAALLAGIILYRLARAVRGYRLEAGAAGPVLWIERLLPLGRRGVPLGRLRNVRA